MEPTLPKSPPVSESKKNEVAHLETARSDFLQFEDEAEEEPTMHSRTYIAISSMFVMILVQVIALQGPSAMLSYIGKSLKDPGDQTWLINCLSLAQAVLAPISSSASDVFQARKALLLGTSVISLIGAAIAPGSQSMSRLIAAQVSIGFGFSVVPLTYCVPSEIMPRRWRPMAQAGLNTGAALGACLGPLMMGSLIKHDPVNGWRTFYWIQTGLWGFVIVGIFFGYRPLKKEGQYDDLPFLKKVGLLDLYGLGLLSLGLTLLLVGLNLGIVVLLLFGLYAAKGTSTGFLHHDLFKKNKEIASHNFLLCVILILIEGILLFAYSIFYPVLTTMLFDADPLLLVAREQTYWASAGLSTLMWGYISTRYRTIKEPLFAGFAIFTAGFIGFCTVQPKDNVSSIVFSGISGIGFGAPLILLITGVQLSTPHHLMATATSVMTSARAVAATTFTAIYTAALATSLNKNMSVQVVEAVLDAGLPRSSLSAFLAALNDGDMNALSQIPGVTSTILSVGLSGFKQAYADSVRVVFLVATPFGALACLLCLFLGNVRKTMNYSIDAPIEDLGPRDHKDGC